MMKHRLTLRFGLRSVLLGTAVIACWLALEVRRAARQERAVAIIREAGGENIFYDYESGAPRTPDWLRRVLGNGLGARVHRIDARGLGLGDSEMDDLTSLGDARELWLWDNPITDDGIARLHLSSFARLESLNLAKTQITDDSLIHLREVPHLRQLYLFDTKITDKGLAQVAQCSKLVELDLEDTAVTDSGLMSLRSLSNLRELNLLNTRVTDSGGIEFQRANPQCNVYWGEL